MSKSLGRRLQMVFQRSGAIGDPGDDQAGQPRLAQALLPLVEFVAYADDCVLSGRVRLAADRLTVVARPVDSEPGSTPSP